MNAEGLNMHNTLAILRAVRAGTPLKDAVVSSTVSRYTPFLMRGRVITRTGKGRGSKYTLTPEAFR